MTYRLHILIALLISIVSLSYGQSISITAFKDMADDITAVSHCTTVIDQNGNAIIIIDNGADDWRSRERKYYQASLVTGKVRELGENECFDYKHGTIINEPLRWDRQFERRDPDIDAEYLAIFMQDPSLEHTLISKEISVCFN